MNKKKEKLLETDTTEKVLTACLCKVGICCLKCRSKKVVSPTRTLGFNT